MKTDNRERRHGRGILKAAELLFVLLCIIESRRNEDSQNDISEKNRQRHPKTTGEKLCSALQEIGGRLGQYPMKWTPNGHSGTLEGAIKNGRMDCSHFASYGLQAIGVLPTGQCIWLTTKIRGKGADELQEKAKSVRHPDRKPEYCHLKTGDIVGFTHPQHTMVYAGRENGRMLWYSGGREEMENRSYGPKPLPFYEDKIVRTVVRLK